jgi:nicotinamidase-related amidase
VTVERTALLVMDIQAGTVASHSRPGVIESIRQAISAARTANIPVIFVKAEFRPGYPDVSPQHRVFSKIAEIGRLVPADPGSAFEPTVEPGPDDIVVTKKRTSAFVGSDLQVVLRSQRIEHLVLLGMRTSGVVAATVSDAAGMDYEMTVLSDCCADVDGEMEAIFLERVFTRYATVCTVGEWAEQLS